METLDWQNDIMEGLADVVKDCFSYMKEKDAIFKEQQEKDDKFTRIINKQNSIIEVQNERLEKQQTCLDTV